MGEGTGREEGGWRRERREVENGAKWDLKSRAGSAPAVRPETTECGRVPGWYYYTTRRGPSRHERAVDGSPRTHPISGALPQKIANAPATHMKSTVMCMRRGCVASGVQARQSSGHGQCSQRVEWCRRHHHRSGRPGHERRCQRAEPHAGYFRRRSHHDFTSASTPSI